MFNKQMHELGSYRSVIRELFEFGKKLAAERGAENVFDFSLGNPNVPPPAEVDESIREILAKGNVHGYTSAQGDLSVRKAVAESIAQKFNVEQLSENHIYMTVGAAAALCIVLRALCEKGDEILTFSPYFPEYKVFAEAVGAKFTAVPMNEDFSPNVEALEKLVTKKTKAVIINSPNNPSGAVYSEQSIKDVCAALTKKSAKFKRPIFLISDEPYREIVYDGKTVPYLMNYYDNTFVCYSYSKSLSLAGERIGYIAVSPKMTSGVGVYAAVCGAGRALGYVCAPSLFQQAVRACINAETNIAAYQKNRDTLLAYLTEFGFSCVKSEGAFYLLVKAPDNMTAGEFSEAAKKHGLLIVPCDGFGAPNYVRLAYCVDYGMIVRAKGAFEKLAEELKVRAIE